MNRRLAQILSYLLHPAVYPVLGSLAILEYTPYHFSLQLRSVIISIVFLGTYLIPVLISYWLYRAGLIRSLEMKQASDRRLPYLVGAICYYSVASILKNVSLAPELYLFLIGSTLVILVNLIMLSFTKPSAHMAGIGGFTALLIALSMQYEVNLLILISICFLLAGVLGTARLSLGAHDLKELGLGYLSGFIICFLSLSPMLTSLY